jgi:hypothetical protein
MGDRSQFGRVDYVPSKSPEVPGTICTDDGFLLHRRKDCAMGRGLLLWLLGVPIPVIILLWLFFGH